MFKEGCEHQTLFTRSLPKDRQPLESKQNNNFKKEVVVVSVVDFKMSRNLTGGVWLIYRHLYYSSTDRHP